MATAATATVTATRPVSLSMVMLEWGSCGQVASVDDKTAGCAFYAPPNMVPRARLFPTSPVSADAILLTTMRIEPSASTSMPLIVTFTFSVDIYR